MPRRMFRKEHGPGNLGWPKQAAVEAKFGEYGYGVRCLVATCFLFRAYASAVANDTHLEGFVGLLIPRLISAQVHQYVRKDMPQESRKVGLAYCGGIPQLTPQLARFFWRCSWSPWGSLTVFGGRHVAGQPPFNTPPFNSTQYVYAKVIYTTHTTPRHTAATGKITYVW